MWWVVAGTLGLAVLVAVARYKHRLVWQELFAQQERVRSLERAQVELLKSLTLSRLTDTRLPSAMPSQNGEDLLLWSFFKSRRQGFFVEIGAYDGVTFSNSYFFESVGWDGLCVEPNPERFKQLQGNRPFSRNVHAAMTAESVGPDGIELNVTRGGPGVDCLSFTMADPEHLQRVQREGAQIGQVRVPALTLDALLDGVEQAVDFISVDVEGAELAVLRGLDLDRIRPRVLLVEDNSQGRDTRVGDYLARFGYTPRCRLEANVFYTREPGDRFDLPGAVPL